MSKAAELAQKIRDLQEELEQEVDATRKVLTYRIEAKKVRFEEEVRAAHRRVRKGLLRFARDSSLVNVLSAPLIYSVLLPLVLIDLWATVYQHLCFRAYGIPRVKRSDHVVIDRQHLAYLNLIEKMNCLYCGYANGVVSYLREIAGRTEQYWCPIKHARRPRGPHLQYAKFLEYGDGAGFREGLHELRRDVRQTGRKGPRQPEADG